jgi:DNA-binding MarR family transcriptional regulator
VKANANSIRRMFESVSLGSPENAIGFVLWRITARYQREMDRALEPLELTHLQFVSLALSAWFASSGGASNQAQLARFGGIHPMQLSQMLTALESKGFISRQRSTTDARAKEVWLTGSGLQILRQALPLGIEVQARLFGEAGRPKGSLHETLVQVDRLLAEKDE